MEFIPFELERWQSQWEHRVGLNLSESGVEPYTASELLDLEGLDPGVLLEIPLGYSQGNGSDELRDLVAGLHPGAERENVVISTGSAEANFLSLWSVVEPGDEVAVLMPTYMQTWGLAQNLGATIREIPMRPDRNWEPDEADITGAIGPRTKLVIVTNPNNPSGHVLGAETLATTVAAAADVGAWVLADEVYRGAELDGATTPTLWGSYERLIVTGSLSKAYGLPGLRIGWVVGPTGFAHGVWERHDYTVICPTPSGDFLARVALRQRDAVLARTRKILNENYPSLETFLRDLGAGVSWTRPDAGAICLVNYDDGPEAPVLAEELRREQDLLIVPGEHFGLGKCIRIGYGNRAEYLAAGLEALDRGLRGMLAIR